MDSSILFLQRLYIIGMISKGKVHPRLRFSGNLLPGIIYKINVMLNANPEISGKLGFLPVSGWIPALKNKSSEKSRINMSVKGPML